MSKIASALTAGVMFVVGASVSDASGAAECTSADTCSRFVACFGYWTPVISDGAAYCKFTATKAPFCSPKNLRDDWVFNATEKECCRGSGSNRTCSRENISCSSDHAYVAATGKCEKVEYSRAILSTASSFNSPEPTRCETPGACKQSLRCPEGFTLSGSPTAKNYSCKRETAATAVPSCAPRDGKMDWRFETTQKQCCRGTGKERACTTENVNCPGGTYKPMLGVCATTATTYAVPTF